MVRSGLLAAALPTTIVTLWALSAPAPALAQPADGSGGGSGSEVELDEDPVSGDLDNGGEENPDAPRLGDQPVDDGPKAPAAKKTGYPINEVARPMTLPDFTSEVRLDLRLFPSPLDAEFGLRARYGITRQAQVGVRYAIGGFYDDGKPAGSDKATFNTGKAVALEFQLLVTPWLAPRLTIPMYVDPFAIAATLGAQMKFRIGDKLALVGFEDVVGFKLTDKFVPDLENERANELAADTLETNGITSDGYIRLDGGVIYQVEDNLAVGGRFGITFNNFDDADAATGLRLNVQFTPRKQLDLIGHLGMGALDDTDTFSLGGALAVRI